MADLGFLELSAFFRGGRGCESPARAENFEFHTSQNEGETCFGKEISIIFSFSEESLITTWQKGMPHICSLSLN